MTIWAEHEVETKVVEVLREVPTVNDAHHFGRPFISAYQLAIGVDRRFPEVAVTLGWRLGGAGVDQRNSLAQYLARELSGRIRRGGAQYPVEGAFMSNIDIHTLQYDAPNGAIIVSSLTDSGWDLSMFRLRA